MVRESRATRIELRRLDAAAVRELVTSSFPLPAPDQRRLESHLARYADGNPLYVGELLRTLEAEARLLQTDDGWRLQSLGDTALPALLRQVIDNRVARLAPATRAALALAAIIGQETPLDLWSDLSGLDDERFADIVDDAVTAHLLEELPSGAGLRFIHALVRAAIYESQPLPRRRVWHRRVAEALLASTSPSPSAVAHHFQQAGDERAFEWHIRAGLRAGNAAWISAAQHFATAASLIEGDERRDRERGWLLLEAGRLLHFSGDPVVITYLESAERLGRSTGDHALAAYALCNLGPTRCVFGDIRAGLLDTERGVTAVDDLREVHHLQDPGKEIAGIARIQRMLPRVDDAGQNRQATPLPDQSRLTLQRGALVHWSGVAGRYQQAIAIGEPFLAQVADTLDANQLVAERFHAVHFGLARAYAAFGRPEDARQRYQIVREIGHAAGNDTIVELTVWSELMLVVIPYQTDQLAERALLRATSRRAWEGCRGLTFATTAGDAPSVLLLDLLEGRWRQAAQLARDHAHAPTSIVRHGAFMALGLLARHRGQPDEAWTCVSELLPDGPATEPGDSCFAPAISTVALAVDLALDSGDLALAQRWIAMHGRWLAWSGARLWLAEHQLLQARYHQVSGDTNLARAHAEAAFNLASEPRQPLRLAAAERLLGGLDIIAGRHERAEQRLTTSLALAEACAAPFERALALLDLARLRVATGRAKDAQALLDDARAIGAALDAAPTLERADALAATLAATPSPVLSVNLSARELEVLRLVVEGRSNKEIADALFISPHTVGSHIANIMNKLDLDSRTAVATWAMRHGVA
jgi:DNA-binding CsgD family transcriptional regulator